MIEKHAPERRCGESILGALSFLLLNIEALLLDVSILFLLRDLRISVSGRLVGVGFIALGRVTHRFGATALEFLGVPRLGNGPLQPKCFSNDGLKDNPDRDTNGRKSKTNDKLGPVVVEEEGVLQPIVKISCCEVSNHDDAPEADQAPKQARARSDIAVCAFPEADEDRNGGDSAEHVTNKEDRVDVETVKRDKHERDVDHKDHTSDYPDGLIAEKYSGKGVSDAVLERVHRRFTHYHRDGGHNDEDPNWGGRGARRKKVKEGGRAIRGTLWEVCPNGKEAKDITSL